MDSPESLRSEAAFSANPLVDWLLTSGWGIADTKVLVGRLGEHIAALGLPLLRMRVTLRILHPQFLGTSYTWQRGVTEVDEYRPGHDILNTDQYLKSPYLGLFQGAGGVRRRLEGPGAVLDFPILQDLLELGATDYVALPMTFSDGRISAITLAADRPGGFSTGELAMIDASLPVLSRLLEVHVTRRTARNIVYTYLGSHAGERVLNGSLRRGDGENIHAVIWFSDLRGSTGLADRLPQQTFLEMLDDYFENIAGAVLDNGGEVLRFIGDAMLAIFPINAPIRREPPCPEHTRACTAALAAARDACARLDAVNGERAGKDAHPIRFGIGVHLGEVMYGNIGSSRRLEFTVIGPAANAAARIESLTKAMERRVLVSQSCADFAPDGLLSLGVHALRGVSEPIELYTFAD